MYFHIYNPSIYSHLPYNPSIYSHLLYRQNLKAKIYINKRNFSTSSKVNSVFTHWPHIQSIINIIRNDENNGKLLESDYTFLTSAILPFYFCHTQLRTWIVAPEFVLPNNYKPDYTIFLWYNNTTVFNDMIHVVVEVKSKTGDSWHILLEKMWNQADNAKDSEGRLWAIGQKGFEICFFKFDVLKYQDEMPQCFTNYVPLNLSNLNVPQLDQLEVKYERCTNNLRRIALIRWRLDNPHHWPYIHLMFEHIKSNNP